MFLALGVSFTAQNQVCAGTDTGSITVFASGGSGSGYQYSVRNWRGEDIYGRKLNGIVA